MRGVYSQWPLSRQILLTSIVVYISFIYTTKIMQYCMKFLRSQIREKNGDNDLEHLHHRWAEVINSRREVLKTDKLRGESSTRNSFD